MNVRHNVDLSAANSLALPVVCSDYIALQHADELSQIVDFAHTKKQSIMVLSGGSNVLLPAKLDAVVLHMCNLGEQIIAEDAQTVIIEVQAGEDWHKFVCRCTARGFYGLENLALIPGRVGAAPIQNIGAYGVEVGDFIHEISAFDLMTRKLLKLQPQACQFAYRDSMFKQNSSRFIITAVAFKLSKIPKMLLNYADVAQQVGDNPTPQRLLDTIIAIRQKKLPDPKHFPNAGSFFKNPVIDAQHCAQLHSQYPTLPHYVQKNGDYKIAAAWLIEQSGWKGKRVGKVGMFERQALVLVNYADATLEDVQATYKQVQQDVWQKFAIALEPEPVLWNADGQIVPHDHITTTV